MIPQGVWINREWNPSLCVTGSQERVPGYTIINEGLFQSANTSTTTVLAPRYGVHKDLI